MLYALLIIVLCALLVWVVTRLRWAFRTQAEYANREPAVLEFEAIASPRLLIAHASGGSPLGNYPNAVECLDWWYQQGVRHFEFDLQWTRDGHLVGLHDWGPTFRRWFDPATLPWHWQLRTPGIELCGLPRDVFLAMGMRGGLTVITPKRLRDWLGSHPDAWLVTDIKRNNPEALTQLAEVFGPLKAQVLAQVFSLAEIHLARELGYARVGWANYVPKLPINELPGMLAGQPLDVVVVNHKTIIDPATHPYLDELRQLGMDLWVFTVNDPERLAELPDSVNGAITDRLLPA